MNQIQIQKRREKRFIWSFGLIFLATLIWGSQVNRKEKYKINPTQIIKGINDAREGRN